MAYSAPSHYLNQCWVIVNWTLRNKLQCNCNITKIQNFSFAKNASENTVCEKAPILSRGRWVKFPQHNPSHKGFICAFITHLSYRIYSNHENIWSFTRSNMNFTREFYFTFADFIHDYIKEVYQFDVCCVCFVDCGPVSLAVTGYIWRNWEYAASNPDKLSEQYK